MKALILTDRKPGHENQSIALCMHLGLDYETLEVSYLWKGAKALSYLLDRLGIYTHKLFQGSTCSADSPTLPPPQLIISTGSTTFYPSKVLAKKLDIPNVAILYPKGYRSNFTMILCPAYDHPPKKENIVELPLNLCAADKTFFEEKAMEFKTKYTPQAPAIGVIIGGSNAVSKIDATRLKKQLEEMFRLTQGYEHWVTTSRRTPKEVDNLLRSLPFDYRLSHSLDPYNPVPAFIHLCDRLFITSDSASMISECASFGSANVEILLNQPLKTPNKFGELIRGLENHNAVHIFDGTLGTAHQKIDLQKTLQKIATHITLDKE